MSVDLKLAITKIGDLLLSDRITWGDDGSPISNISLVIPDYQRPYKWVARNVIQLTVRIKNRGKYQGKGTV